MIEVHVSCSHHQKPSPPQGMEIVIDSIDDTNRKHVQGVLERRGWIVEYNGNYMDTYCSKECAQ